MLVRVVCPILPLARSVAAALEAAGHQVEVSPQPAFSCELRHTGAVLPSYTALAAAVLPFEVTLSRVGRLDGADVELHLGHQRLAAQVFGRRPAAVQRNRLAVDVAAFL